MSRKGGHGFEDVMPLLDAQDFGDAAEDVQVVCREDPQHLAHVGRACERLARSYTRCNSSMRNALKRSGPRTITPNVHLTIGCYNGPGSTKAR